MKRSVLFAAALAATSVSATTALTNAQTQRPEGEQRQQQTAGKQLTKADREFVDKAAMANLEEISLGQVALQHSENAEVKRFAQRMIDDHTAANNKLADITRNKGITLPRALDQKHQEKVDKLSKKSGAEFDRDYIKEMVDGHKTVVDEFEKAAKDSKDPDIKSYAASTLPTLQEHQNLAKQLHDKVKK